MAALLTVIAWAVILGMIYAVMKLGGDAWKVAVALFWVLLIAGCIATPFLR